MLNCKICKNDAYCGGQMGAEDPAGCKEFEAAEVDKRSALDALKELIRNVDEIKAIVNVRDIPRYNSVQKYPYAKVEYVNYEDYSWRHIEANQYQELASRTMNKDLKPSEQGKHALHGMVGEIGEIHSIYQKRYQGHEFDEEHAKKELGDLLWFIAEYCTAHNWRLSDIMRMNIEKLYARYPEGFDADHSLNRAEGDI